MGRSKALLPYRGVTLAQWVARQVEEAVGNVTLLADRELGGALGLAAIADEEAGRGPLGGLRTAVRAGKADWNLIVACDMPNITTEVLRGILSCAEEREKLSIVPVHQNGDPEPLCAVYHSAIAPIIETEYAADRLSMRNLLEKIGFISWPIKDLSAFVNVNSLPEFVAAGGGLEPAGGTRG